MKWPRVSILGLIAGVVACGVVFAALRGGSDHWLGAFYSMTVELDARKDPAQSRRLEIC
jgi:hypothetical protein